MAILPHRLTPRGYNIAPPAEAFRLTIFDGLKPILRTAILPFQGDGYRLRFQPSPLGWAKVKWPFRPKEIKYLESP